MLIGERDFYRQSRVALLMSAYCAAIECIQVGIKDFSSWGGGGGGS